MSGKGRAYVAQETWRPTCKSDISDYVRNVFMILFDKCKRKQGHSGRCVGNFYVWDRHKLTTFEERYTRIEKRNK